MSTLQEKQIVVVGGSSGIGFAVSLAALQSLASLVVIASSNPDRVADAVNRLKSHSLPGEVRGYTVDARDSSALKKLAEDVGEVDHVVWTAGDTPGGRAAELQASQTGLFAVRFWGPFIFSQSVRIRAGGSLTLTTGPRDFKPQAGLAAGGGLCAALHGLVKGLAVDLAPVRVNVVSAGVIRTELIKRIPREIREKLKIDEAVQQLLIKRIGEPDEIAETYIFLMKCGYITGQRINVDGGIELI